MDVFEAVFAQHRGWFEQAAIAAAHTLGLPAALPGTTAELIARLGVSDRLVPLLDALASIEVIHCEPPEWRARSFPPPVPVPETGWGCLAEVIRTDTPLPADAVAYQPAVADAGRDAAAELADRLPTDTLLDLGGGIGTYAEAWARHGATVYLVDRAEVLASCRPGTSTVMRMAEDLFTMSPDAFRQSGYPIPDPARTTVLLSNVLHLYGAAECQALLHQAARIGQRVIIKDLDPNTLPGCWFSVNMALYTPAGRVWDQALIGGWLRTAGFELAGALTLDRSPNSLVLTASRPALPKKVTSTT